MSYHKEKGKVFGDTV